MTHNDAIALSANIEAMLVARNHRGMADVREHLTPGYLLRAPWRFTAFASNSVAIPLSSQTSRSSPHSMKISTACRCQTAQGMTPALRQIRFTDPNHPRC